MRKRSKEQELRSCSRDKTIEAVRKLIGDKIIEVSDKYIDPTWLLIPLDGDRVHRLVLRPHREKKSKKERRRRNALQGISHARKNRTHVRKSRTQRQTKTVLKCN